MAVPASPALPHRRAAPVASHSEVVDHEAQSPPKKLRPSAAGGIKTTTADKGKAAVTRKQTGSSSKKGGQATFKRLRVLTVSALSKAVQEAARTATAIAARFRSDNGGASSASDAALTTSETHEAIRKMVVEVLHPVVVEIVESSKDVERLRADHSRLSRKVEAQGVGHEMTAKAVVELRDQAPVGVKTEPNVKASVVVDPSEPPIDVDAIATANKNYSNMAVVRSELRKVLEHETAHAITSRQVLYSAERLTVIMSEVVERTRNCDAAEANHYLCHPTLFPVRNRPSKTQFVKIQKPLNGHVSHMFTDFRKWVLPVYWEVLGIDGDNVGRKVAETWLDKDEFMISDRGQQAVGAAAKAFFRRTGAHDRVIKSAGAGGIEHVSMTVGHFMLFGSFARHELMVAAELRPRHRKGSADGTYKWWCEEAGPVRTIMPTSAAVFNGISIVDYSDPRRFDMVLNPTDELSGSGSSSGAAASSPPTAARARLGEIRADEGEAAAGAAPDDVDNQAASAAAAANSVDDLDDYGDANLHPSPTTTALHQVGKGSRGGGGDDEGFGAGNRTDEEAEGEDGEEAEEAEGAGENEVGGSEEDDLALDDADLIL